MGRQSGEIHLVNMIKLVALCRISSVSAGLVTYPNGAVVPFDHANQAATASHLATKGLYTHAGLYHAGVYGHLWKREAEAEADAGLVGYSNGAVVPYNPYLHGFGAHHVAYGHLWKREAEADPAVVYSTYAHVPHVYAAHHVVGTPLVAHSNGAVVPLEPASVVQARAQHLATKFGI